MIIRYPALIIAVMDIRKFLVKILKKNIAKNITIDNKATMGPFFPIKISSIIPVNNEPSQR